LVKVPEEIREAFTKNSIIPLATADASGKPNVILVGMWWWEDDETLVVVNNYLNKTWANLNANPQVKSEGSIYEKGYKMATNRERPLPGKAVVVINVEEVYQASGGPTAGDRIV